MNFSLESFIARFYGEKFLGEIKIWSRQTKRTASFGPDRNLRTC